MRDNIITALLEGVTTVSFIKVDGERRDMRCTLNAQHLPAQPETVETADVKPARKVNPDVQQVWDIDKQAWRSFNWTRVITDE